MRLTDIEEAMARGEHGAPRQWAIQHMQQVGRAFDAADLVEVHQAHIMADTESLGEAGVAFLERLGQAPAADRRVRVPTITDPRGIAFRKFADQTKSDRHALAACIRTSRQLIGADEIARIDAPALVAVGTRDDIAGDPHKLAALLPNGEGFDIEGRDHMLAVGDRSFKKAVLEFLEANP